MKAIICKDVRHLGQVAAEQAARILRKALETRGEASVGFMAGSSQFETITGLIATPEIDWARVTGYQLAEFVGLGANHRASMQLTLRQRVAERVPLRAFHFIHGDAADPAAEATRFGTLLKGEVIDLLLTGIGVNGRVAFNDPPADFTAFRPCIVAPLGRATRQQQVDDGVFPSIDAVPEEAITISVNQLMKAEAIVCSTPEERRAKAVKATVDGPVAPEVPASMLQRHPRCDLILDRGSASLLKLEPPRKSANRTTKP